MKPFPGFVGPAYQHRAINVAAERLINLYPERIETPGAKASYTLLRTPGMKTYGGVSEVVLQNRPLGLYPTDTGRLFQVAGNSLYEVTPGGQVFRGTLSTSTGNLGMADNGTVLFIVDGLYYYTFNLQTNTFAKVTDAALTTGATHVAWLGGYFAVNDRGTSRWRVSPLHWNGITPWDATEFEEAEGSPDIVTALLKVGDQLWVFGPSSYQIYWHSGDVDFPFALVPGSVADIGTPAPYSVAKGAGSALWLGGNKEGDGQVLRSQGAQAVRISTHAVETDLSTFADRSDAIGFTYQQEGHTFYVLSFPTGNRTWVYDLTTGFWAQRAYRNPVDGTLGRHLAIACASLAGRVLLTAYGGLYAQVYEWDLATYTDAGDPIKWLRASPHLGAAGSRITVNRFELDAERGVGLASGQGQDPQVMLRTSKDGGHTWGAERWKSMGAMGKYTTRIGWDRLGTARDWVFEVSGTDPVKVALSGAFLDAEVEG
jgi:hypothetical protein